MNMRFYQMTLLLFMLLLTVGCSMDTVEEGVSPHAVYILSVSEDRPAEMRIGWMYYGGDRCDEPTGGAAERNGNNIEVTIDVTFTNGAVDCHPALSNTYGEFTVKNLEVGEYIIKSGAHEVGWLRIEPETAYSFVDSGSLLFNTKAVTSNDEEHIRDTYHVTASFSLPGAYNCEPIIKTNIARMEDVINIEAWRVVPKTGCLVVDYRNYTDQHERKFIDIDLGTFSAGSYTIIINDDWEHTLDVPPPMTDNFEHSDDIKQAILQR